VGEALDASFLVVDDVEERAPVKLDMGEDTNRA
jgi:hypothetical protein